MKKVIIGGGIAAAVGLVAALGYAAVASGGASPHLIPYVGHLDHDGMPVTGKVALKVCLVSNVDTDCDKATWFEEFDSVDVAGGNFSLVLGQTKPVDAAMGAGGNLYIRAMVGATVAQGTPTFVQLSGAQQVLSVPFAIAASQASDFRVEGPLHTGAVVPTNKELGIYEENASKPIRINTNGGPVTVDLGANANNGFSPNNPMLSVRGDGVQFGTSLPIHQITNCYHQGLNLPGPNKQYAWVAGDCDNGLPTGGCYGVLSRGSECATGSVNWTVFAPGQNGLAHGGVYWYHDNDCGSNTSFEVDALYFCQN